MGPSGPPESPRRRPEVWAGLLGALVGAAATVAAAVISSRGGSGTVLGIIEPVPTTVTVTVPATVPAASGGGGAGTPSAQDSLTMPGSMVGTWKGVVTQGSEKVPVTLRLTGGGTGTVVGEAQYLHCTTALTLLSGGSDVELEQSMKGAGNCEIDNDLKLTLAAGSLDYSTPYGEGVLSHA